MNDITGSPSPEQASLLAAGRDLAAGGLVAVEGGILTKVHPGAACAGTNCWVHNPSTHQMITWTVRWREDKYTAERVCSHGIGHPDPDDVSFHARAGRNVSVHGCDGCCGAKP